ncbi:neuronal pentraxin-2-like [Ptychodera flava]|uniref:neuronal pentraxin-2-like n=1 Tax=Ptychodera flava TaxID=63121 RepID=UPI00396A1194
MNEMSTCLWVKIKQQPTPDHVYTFISYAISNDSNAIAMENEYKPGKCMLLASLSGKKYWFTLGESTFVSWTFWCFTWKLQSQDYLLYINGNNLARSSEHSKSKPNHKQIDGGGVLVLGQDQDNVGGGFFSGQAFQGDMTEFNLWNRFISKQEIQLLMMSTCGIDDHDVIVSWHSSTFELFNVTEVEQMHFENKCKY